MNTVPRMIRLTILTMLALLLVLITQTASASSVPNWVFVKGSGDYLDELGVYNAPLPGSRNRAATWTDTSGNQWLFGGHGYAASGSSGYLNDLWKYDPVTGSWQFIKGSGDY